MSLVTSDPTLIEGYHVVIVLAWLLVLVLWCAARYRDHESARRIDLLDATVLAFFGWYIISGVVNLHAGHGRAVLNALWVWAAFGVLYFVLRDVARSAAHRRALVAVVIASGVGLAAAGIYEYTVSMPRARAQFRANPEKVLRELGIDAPPGSPDRRQLADRIAGTEPNATFALPNSLAGFLVPPALLIVALLVWPPTHSGFTGARAIGLGGALLVLVTCLLMTKSRAAIIATVIGALMLGGFSLVARGRSWRRLVAVVGIIVAVAIGGIAAALGAGLWDRQVLTEAPKSMRYRLEFWQSAAGIIRDHVWLGCGPGNFQSFYTQYKLPQASETIAEPHNFVMEIASTAGVPALALFAAIAGVLVWRSWRRSDAAAGDNAGRFANGGSSRLPFAVIGAAAGVALVAGIAVNQLPDPEVLVIWLIVAGGTLWVLQPWVQSGRLPSRALEVCLLALLLNLSVSGGIGIPGVGWLVWLLIGLIAARTDSTDRRAPARPWLLVATVGSGLVLVVAYWTYYSPVLTAHREMMRAAAAKGTVLQTVKYLQAAADADPWWARPYMYAAEICHRQWLVSPAANWRPAFDQGVRLALRRNAHSYRLQQQKGDWLLIAYQRHQDPVLLERAVEAYQGAIRFYPNSNFLHAQLAWALHLDGQDEAARRQADRALRLDAQLPHAELKLGNRQLVGTAPVPNAAAKPPANAEQTMVDLRKSRSEP